MTPRGRGPGRDLPPNTYRNPAHGALYYRWIHPVTGKRTSLGRDLETAVRRASDLNDQVEAAFGAITRSALTARGGEFNVTRVLEQWWDHYVPRQDWSPRYREEMRILQARYTKRFGKYSFLGITRTVLQKSWAELSGHAWQRHRQFWIHVFRFAISQSNQIEANEAEATLAAAPKALERQRSRHTVEGYDLIRAAASRPLQVAMDLALYSLQRRDDLVHLKREDVIRDQEPWLLQVSPAKSKRRGVHLRIAVPKGTKLREALEAALALPAELGVVTPYLLAHKPRRRRHGSQKTSVYQWTPKALTVAFTEARDRSEAYGDLPAEKRPTLHQLRALGSWLYREAGVSDEHIQVLMGHASVKMTEAYQAGHQIDWQDVEARL